MFGYRKLPEDASPRTQSIHAGQLPSQYMENAEAIYMTSGFTYASAEEAEAAFKGEVERYVYSRYANPTVSMFEERLRLLEGAEACMATGSGMAAVFAALACQIGAGERLVASRGVAHSQWDSLFEHTVSLPNSNLDGLKTLTFVHDTPFL